MPLLHPTRAHASRGDQPLERLVHTLEAERVFLCAGAIETPKLLLASANTWWETGIGNSADLVGRFLSASPFLSSQAVRATERPWPAIRRAKP